jgi:phosphoadenosine phosphosulfate reductase
LPAEYPNKIKSAGESTVNSEKEILELQNRFDGAPAEEILEWAINEFKDQIAFASSFGLEDQVIMRMISGMAPAPRVFTLDTGRLFQETYDLLDLTQKKYAIPVEVFFPDAARVEGMVQEKGINLFYESVENRQLCCHIRKIEPLRRALNGCKAWITGLRSEQSMTRRDVHAIEIDSQNNILKINPLINWSLEQVWDYIREHNIPYNPLHDKGYPSIGCLPCTRAIDPGEDIRAGRWWWELPQYKECGLHKKD